MQNESEIVTYSSVSGIFSHIQLEENSTTEQIAKNTLKILFSTRSLCVKKFPKKLLCALFFKKDLVLLQAIQEQVAEVCYKILKKLQQSENSAEGELCKQALDYILALYPFLEPLGPSLNIPQKIDNVWQLVEYHVEKIELTPASFGSPQTALGLTANGFLEDRATPLLLLMGTPLPTGQGAFMSLWSDLVPGFAVGSLLFKLFASKKIQSFLQKCALPVNVYGVSLGASLALHTAKQFPEKVGEVYAFAPGSLFSYRSYDPKIKTHIFWQKNDPVPLLGGNFPGQFQLFSVEPKQAQNFFLAHERTFPFLSPLQVKKVDAKAFRKPFLRLLFNALHVALSLVMFPVLTAILALRFCTNSLKKLCCKIYH